jgi:hypothetical protein
MRVIAIVLVTLGTAAPAKEPEYLAAVTSEVYQTPGSPKELASRAQRCITQRLAAGTIDAPVILNSELDAGVVVARNAMRYGGLVTWQIRSTFSFEARENRFRISQTNIERFYDNGTGWGPIGKWWGSDWKKAEKNFAEAATIVANCVMTPDKKDDW